VPLSLSNTAIPYHIICCRLVLHVLPCCIPLYNFASNCKNTHRQVCVSLLPEALLASGWGQLQPGAALVVSAPGMSQLQVPLTDPAAPAAPSQLK
jgi:hypothetical protein